MAILTWDRDTMSSIVLPELNKCCKNLEDAEDILSTIKVPKNFSKAKELSNILNKIKETIEDTNNIKNWAIKAALKFDEVENQNQNFLNQVLNGSFGILYQLNPQSLNELRVNKAINDFTNTRGYNLRYNSLNDVIKELANIDRKKLDDVTLKKLNEIDDIILKQYNLKLINGNYEKLGTIDALIASAIEIHNSQLDYTYHGLGDVGPGLKYTTFEDSLNNPNKTVCCATQPNLALINSGYATEADFAALHAGTFNCNIPNDTKTILNKVGATKITDYKELQPGDYILYYYPDGKGEYHYSTVGHVEIYLGTTDDGKTLWVNSGGYGKSENGEIQTPAPLERSWKTWYAYNGYKWVGYRLPEDTTTTNPIDTLPYQEEEKENNVIVVTLENETESNNQKVDENKTTKNPVKLDYDSSSKTNTNDTNKGQSTSASSSSTNKTSSSSSSTNKTSSSSSSTKKPSSSSSSTKKPSSSTSNTTTSTNSNANTNTNTNSNSSSSGITHPTIVDCTPEAILDAAQNVQENTSYSTYLGSVLYSSGYISEVELHQYKDYSVEMICERLTEFGWENITDTSALQAGDIVFIDNVENDSILIYAGDNKWYSMGNTEAIEFETGLNENITWSAYRPPIGRTETAIKV